MIKLADTLVPMADFPAVMAEHTEFADGESLQEKLDNGALGGGGASYKQLSQAEYDALTDDEKMDGREYRTYDTGHIYKLGIEYGKEDAIYTSLAELGITAPVTVGDIYNAMDDKTIAMIACEGTKAHITDIPSYYGILTIKRARVGRFSIEFQSSSGVSATDVKRWIGTLKGTDGSELTWKLISTQTTYVALSDMELTAEATVQDVIDALPIGCTALLRTDEFTNWSTLFNDIQYGYLKIEKTVNGLSNIELQEVISPNRRYFGVQSGGNFDKWQKPIDQFYRIITQEKDGYLKFKPCSDPKTQGIRITATDNYGGMIDISGVAPTQTQYKPFKCVRLSHGTYTDYNASNPTSNKMEKLFFLNGYMYLKIVAYTTVTFTNLIEEPTFVETIEEGAEEIPIRSVFDIPYNDGYADPSIIVIGDTNSDNGVIKTLDTLGFTKDIMTWDTGVYRVSHVSGLIGLPSDITNTTPSFRLEHHNIKKWGNGHSPSKSTWAQRHSIIYCDNGNIYQRFYTSGDTAGVYTKDTGWQQIHTKKEDDSYVPDMYDRNANGDMPVVPFDRLANCIAVRSNRGLVSATETEATYNEDYVGGYVFNGANDVLIKDKEMFNKIKVLVHIPGVLRIGIVNEKIYEANPRYSTCLVKWLVADFVAFTGMKEYDIDDTVLEEGQSIFLECRTGVSSWYLNTGEATQVGAITYPANSCTTGLRGVDKLDSTTNNVLFKSQKVNSSSCLTSFGTNMYSIGGNIRGNFRERAYDSGASSTKKADENLEYFGGLNVGLYRRTKYSDTRICKCIENGMNISWVGDVNVTKIYAPYGQEKIVGKSVYAIKLDVRIPGNLTIYHLKGKSLDTVQVIDKYTHYVRAVGLQTIHLPFDIKLNSTDEYIGFGGLHCKSTSDNIVRYSCQWQYLDASQATWMTTIDNSSKKFYSIGVSNTVYPEKFTSFETNSNYVNIELICRGEKRSPLEDKYISFTGDSITTYTGFCTTKTGYPEGNPAGDNAVYYPASGKVVNNVDATWWGILARDNRMKILRNDAWSGSRVSSSEGSTDTKCLCGVNRRYYLKNGYNFATNSTYPFGRPEIVVSMIGTNDLSGNVELGSEMFRGVMGAEEEYKTILSAFSLFCRRIHDQEGNGGAKIVHFLIPRGSDYGYANANGVTIADLSLHFERIAKAWGQYFIPLSYFNGIKPNAPKRWSCPTGSMFKNTTGVEFPSADGLHPNAMGMEAIADGVHRFLCSIM